MGPLCGGVYEFTQVTKEPHREKILKQKKKKKKKFNQKTKQNKKTRPKKLIVCLIVEKKLYGVWLHFICVDEQTRTRLLYSFLATISKE